MNDEAAFLAAIAASPKDELQYLVFADWLPVSPVRNLGRTAVARLHSCLSPPQGVQAIRAVSETM